MTRWMMVMLAVLAAAPVALAQDEPAEPADAAVAPDAVESEASWAQTVSLSVIAVAVMGGVALVIFGGARAISAVANHTVDAIARQPEASGSMFMAWLLPAAMIEGAVMFALVIVMMAMNRLLG